eukprot:gene8287-9137_t
MHWKLFIVLLSLSVVYSYTWVRVNNNIRVASTFRWQKLSCTTTTTSTSSNTAEETESSGNQPHVEETNQETPDLSDQVTHNVTETAASTNATTTVVEEDPKQIAIAKKEKSLRIELETLEDAIRRDRLELITLKDRLSESGKKGFFLVQAQVNDFLRKKDEQQKQKVAQNKKEFVEKMLPVVELFRSAPSKVPAETEREEKMYKSFGALLESIVNVIEKYGYKHLLEEVKESAPHTPDPIEHELPSTHDDSQAGVAREEAKEDTVETAQSSTNN